MILKNRKNLMMSIRDIDRLKFVVHIISNLN